MSESDEGELEHRLRERANVGDLDAMCELADLLEDRWPSWGTVAAQDRDRHNSDLLDSQRWHQMAAEAGHLRAMRHYGRYLSRRHWDKDSGEQWLRAAIGRGDVPAIRYLAELLDRSADAHARFYDMRTAFDALEESETWYRRAVAAGDAAAVIRLAHFLGQRGKMDEAGQYFRRSIEQGDPRGMHDLWWFQVRNGLEEDAERWLRERAVQGDLEAMYELHYFLRQIESPDDADRWVESAAEMGHLPSMSTFATRLLGEIGVEYTLTPPTASPERVALAEYWYRRCAGPGNDMGAAGTGWLLARTGRVDEAEQWFADHGMIEDIERLRDLIQSNDEDRKPSTM